MAKHALLSASSSKQWLNCPPSARLQEPFPNETSEYAEEGTWAHELCEYKVRKYLKERVQRPQSEYLSEEIDEITEYYLEFIVETVEELKRNGSNPLVLVEEKLDYSHVVPSGFGTGDCVIIADGVLNVVDFKTGRGVFVSSDHNSQMMLYALGALHAYAYLYDIHTVKMTIVQPRMNNISTFTMSTDELNAWAEEIRPIAQIAYEGKGEQKCGDWCKFCRAKAVCKARADEALALAREDFLDLDEGVLSDATAEETDATGIYKPDRTAPVFKSPALISKPEIEAILPTLNRISDWIEAVFAYVSSEAINHGVTWKGYKVVEGRSNRKFTDMKKVVEAAAKAGYHNVYKQPALISLTEFEKMMGKDFPIVLGKYVVKPPGKPTLVPESDDRPAIDFNNTAQDEFEDLGDE